IPSYLKGEKNLWTNLKTLLKSPEFRPLRIAVVSQMCFLYLIVHIGMIVFINHPFSTRAATFGWVQTDWSGGVSSTSAGHPDDVTGWTLFTSSSHVAAGSDLQLSTDEYVFTDDATTSTDGLATGGGFYLGTTS